jgi:hypothetical protein
MRTHEDTQWLSHTHTCTQRHMRTHTQSLSPSLSLSLSLCVCVCVCVSLPSPMKRVGVIEHLGRARCEKGGAAAHGEGADVCRVEAIHILLDADGIQHTLLIDVARQGQLYQDAVYCRVRIVVLDHLHAS